MTGIATIADFWVFMDWSRLSIVLHCHECGDDYRKLFRRWESWMIAFSVTLKMKHADRRFYARALIWNQSMTDRILQVIEDTHNKNSHRRVSEAKRSGVRLAKRKFAKNLVKLRESYAAEPCARNDKEYASSSQIILLKGVLEIGSEAYRYEC